MLEAACQQNSGYKDVRNALENEGFEEDWEGLIAALFRESVCHNMVLAEEMAQETTLNVRKLDVIPSRTS